MNVRKLRVEEFIKRILGKVFLKHPIVSFEGIFLRVSQVKMHDSLRSGKVFVTSNDTIHHKDIIDQLNKKEGTIRHYMSIYWKGYSVPHLTFFWDDLPDYVEKIDSIIKRNQSS